MAEQRRILIDDKGMPVRKQDAAPEPEHEGQRAPCDCPVLEAGEWDGVESDWSDIAFVSSSTNAVLGVPVGFESSRDELRAKARKLGATVPDDAMLLLGPGKFRRPILLEVEDVPQGAKGVERPGGYVFTRLLPAPLGELNKVVDATRADALARYGRAPDDVWVWYLTCRNCSWARGFETLVVAHYRTRP